MQYKGKKFKSKGKFVYNRASVVALNGKCGYIDKDGNYIVQPIYDICCDFFQQRGVVRQGDKWGLVDMDGNVLLPPSLDVISYFHVNRAQIRLGQKYGFIDYNGKFAIIPIYEFVMDFRNTEEAYARLPHNKAGVIDDYGFIHIHSLSLVE